MGTESSFTARKEVLVRDSHIPRWIATALETFNIQKKRFRSAAFRVGRYYPTNCGLEH